LMNGARPDTSARIIPTELAFCEALLQKFNTSVGSPVGKAGPAF